MLTWGRTCLDPVPCPRPMYLCWTGHVWQNGCKSTSQEYEYRVKKAMEDNVREKKRKGVVDVDLLGKLPPL